MSKVTSIANAFTSIFSSLTAAGIPNAASAAGSAIVDMFGGVAATVKPMLATVLANYGDPAVVNDELMKINEVSGLPAGVVPLLQALPGAAAAAQSNPATGLPELTSLIGAIEGEL